MADPTLLNGQITDVVTGVNSSKNPVMQELVGQVIQALGVAARKGLDEADRARALAIAAAVCGVNRGED